MGPAGLTAVFGMGTGVTPPVWSPEKRPGGGQAARATGRQWGDWSQREHVHNTRGQVGLSGTDLLRYGSVSQTYAATGGEPIGVVKLLGC